MFLIVIHSFDSLATLFNYYFRWEALIFRDHGIAEKPIWNGIPDFFTKTLLITSKKHTLLSKRTFQCHFEKRNGRYLTTLIFISTGVGRGREGFNFLDWGGGGWYVCAPPTFNPTFFIYQLIILWTISINWHRWLLVNNHIQTQLVYRCHYTKSNPIDNHSNISSKKLQKQNFKSLGHYTCMQCGTSHLQKVQENILSHIILATYRKFTVTTLRFTQNVSCNIFTHPIYQQVANVTV